MAEYLLRTRLGPEAGWQVASAGVFAGPGGRASEEAVRAMREVGIDMAAHRSQLLSPELVANSDLILVMTRYHYLDVVEVFPEAAERTFLMTSFQSDGNGQDIPDPIGGSLDVYRWTRDRLDSAIADVILYIKDRWDLPSRPKPKAQRIPDMEAATASPDIAAAFDAVARTDPEMAAVLTRELQRQEENLELIASENIASEAVRVTQGSVLGNKYAEGYPGKRWYHGCEFVDQAEQLAIDRARQLFGAEHANVQPHSGSQANMGVYFSVMQPGDTILAMSLDHGGHLTHGHGVNFSGRFFKVVQYGVHPETELIDYDQMAELARQHRPKMLIGGASAYSRIIDFERMRQIADDVGAMLMIDMAHIAGLVAAGCHPNPVPYCDFVTTTTHKTLRGPRGGMILCREQYAKDVDRQIFPGTQGGPFMHSIAAKAVCFHEALQPSFKTYQQQVAKNAQALAIAMEDNGFRIVSGGTDNHLMLVDLTSIDVTGKDAAAALDKARITVNKNAIPFDQRSPFVTSGIRLGSPTVTTRGMKEPEMAQIAHHIKTVLDAPTNDGVIDFARNEVIALTSRFPLA
jgi:glycine hydroxymethyltransferase